ncbi:MAG TPA: Uma2 family endonuclease [Pyrinomonadaceae bacterium]|jgi:Uma2 family endonuclease|nr:Uma2 family endonuclease [Pyrinomonadaceae bacterium]
MSTTTRLITADELFVMPHRDEHGNDCRLELIRGEVRRMSPTGITHGFLCIEVGAEVRNFVKGHDLGIVCGAETGFVVERDPDSVIAADVAFISHERLATVEDPDKFGPSAPDLAVEVLSPGNRPGEMSEKIALYFAAGARAVWVFNPKKKTVAVYASPSDVRVLSEHDTLEGGEVLPGFRLELSKLFAVGKK